MGVRVGFWETVPEPWVQERALLAVLWTDPLDCGRRPQGEMPGCWQRGPGIVPSPSAQMPGSSEVRGGGFPGTESIAPACPASHAGVLRCAAHPRPSPHQ